MNDELDERRHLLSDAGREKAVGRQHERGKLTARERIALLLDDDFVELGGHALAPDVAVPADGVVTGIGHVDGRPVGVVATDFTAAGGSNGAIGNAKMERVFGLAGDHGFPVVLLLDAGGHRIQEGLDARDFAIGADVIQAQVDLSGRVPLVSVMLGPTWGAATIIASLSDYVVAVRGIAHVGLAPPPLVKAGIGEDVSADELGGPDAQVSNGVVDVVLDTEDQAMDEVRAYLSYLPTSAEVAPPGDESLEPEPALADDAVPADLRRPYDVRVVVDGLVDDESAFELRPMFAPNMVTAFARIGGRPVGVLANNPMARAGVLDTAACEKAARFINTCDAYGLALVVLVDMPGFLVGSAAERSGLARRSGLLLHAFGVATVPRATVVLRKGYGAAYLAMSGGRTFRPDLVLAWPTAQTAAMAVETALDVAYRRELAAAEDPAAARAEMAAEVQQRLGALRGAEGFGYDDVIRPSETRARLVDLMQRAPVRRTPSIRRVRPIPPT